VLVPVDRFSTLLEGTKVEDLRAVWTGRGSSKDFTTLYPTQDCLAELTALFGPPSPAVKPQPGAAEVADQLWQDNMALGIVPFDQLMPRLHALPLDGVSAVDNRFDQSRWPLIGRGQVSNLSPQAAAALRPQAAGQPLTNRDPALLTVLVMTGVTALTRGTGVAIENARDPAYPARLIGPELAAADLTTASNEVAFMDGCVADNSEGLMVFCSKPEWFATLEFSGVDLVDLTGNHLLDFGVDPLQATLSLYAQKGIKTYGGGANDAAGHAPLVVTNHGNRLAFLGANEFGPQEAWAGADSPGSGTYDRDQMIAAIQTVKPQVDLVFVDLQWQEDDANGDYTVQPIPGQAEDFEALSDAGATVVTGVQAHAPQGVELRDGRVVLFGLGNLYFDQTWSWETSTGLVARHTIYEGRLLNTELLVTVIGPNMQLRWATSQERAQVLQSVFGASRW
jgi:hypothetical protein